MAANLLVTISCMLFEGGSILALLPANAQGEALAAKIEAADKAAMDAGQTEFDLQLNPIELGMAWTALTAGSSPLAESLGAKMRDALAAKLQELGIEYGGNGVGQGGDQPQPLGDGMGESGDKPAADQPADDGAESDPADEQPSGLGD